MDLTGKQRRYLTKLAHNLDPTVMVGKEGYTEAVCKATDESLAHHELIKIRFVSNKDEKREISNQIADATESVIVQIIGNVATLFRQSRNPEKRTVTLPGD